MGFPSPSYRILYFGGLWAFPPTPIYLIPSFGLLWPILAYFPFLIMLMGLLFLSSGFFGSACFLWDPFAILQAYGPLFLPFGFNDFLLNLLILLFYSLPYCWGSSYYWTFLPKWASTIINIFFFLTVMKVSSLNFPKGIWHVLISKANSQVYYFNLQNSSLWMANVLGKYLRENSIAHTIHTLSFWY